MELPDDMISAELAAIRHLREAGKSVVKWDREGRGQCPGTCHCVFCCMDHALAVTSGYEEPLVMNTGRNPSDSECAGPRD